MVLVGLGKIFFGVTALGHCRAGYRDRDRRSDNRPLRRVQEEKTASTLKWSRTWPGMHRGVDRRAVTCTVAWLGGEKRLSMLK